MLHSSQISNSHQSMHWIGEALPFILLFYFSILNLQHLCVSISVSCSTKIILQRLLSIYSPSLSFCICVCVLIHSISLAILFLATYLPPLSSPCSIFFRFIYFNAMLATHLSIRFSIECYLFPSVSIPLHLYLNYVYTYINYVYSTVLPCTRLLPVYRVNTD